MRIDPAMEDFVVKLLIDHIPADLYYHNVDHTKYVQQKALEIGKYEDCRENELRLLNAAALWHDTGHIVRYAGHEEESVLLAKKYLPDFGFSAAEIESICGMIRATKVPQSPQNKLEEIIADADLEYFGAPDADEKAALLFKELQSLTPMLTETAWNRMQIDFLRNHHYFTRYCRTEKEPVKQAYLTHLITP